MSLAKGLPRSKPYATPVKVILRITCDTPDGYGCGLFGRQVNWPGTPVPGQRFADTASSALVGGPWRVADVVFDISEPGELRVELEAQDIVDACKRFYENNPDAERHTWRCNFMQACTSLLEGGWAALIAPAWRSFGDFEILVSDDADVGKGADEAGPDPERN